MSSPSHTLAEATGNAIPLPDIDFIRRYDRNGPRYTSYPTALQFDPAFSSVDYRAAVARANAVAPAAPLSIYVHIPFCASPCFYCACTKVITRQTQKAEPYLERLAREIDLQARLFPRTRRIEQLHFGGGTPTFLSVEQLGSIVDALDHRFMFGSDAAHEFSIEVDPRTIKPAKIGPLATLGFNRISLGIQDFDPAVQRAVNREQSVDDVARLVEAVRRAGFRSLSMDLIYGLPLQTPQSFSRTLDHVIALQPDRIAAYSYAHLPSRFRAQRHIVTEQLPDAATKLELLRLTIERLLGAGYVHIGMDHFARPDDELARALRDGSLQRNFQGYSTRGDLDLVGLGMSAIGRVGDVYSQNARTLTAYDAAIDNGALPIDRGLRLSADDLLRRDVIAAIMCRGWLHFADFEERHGIVFHQYFAEALQQMQVLQSDGLVEVGAGTLRVTPLGRYLLRVVAMPFDAYLRRRGKGTEPPAPTHSRVI
jgi:oxygen-independent coproporphyrinogen-3 oxidase